MKDKLRSFLTLIGVGNKHKPSTEPATAIPRIIETLIITDARKNGSDISEQYADESGCLTIYSFEGDERTYLSNKLPNSNDQSYGHIYNIQSETFPESSDMHKTQAAAFKWSYVNSFDAHKGTATASVSKVFKPIGTSFIFNLVTETLDEYEYKGYVKGSLNLNYQNHLHQSHLTKYTNR